MIITNNDYMHGFFSQGSYPTWGIKSNLGGLASTTTAGSSIGSAIASIGSAVPQLLQAQNAENLIKQENTAANSFIGLIPFIVIGGLAILLLRSK